MTSITNVIKNLSKNKKTGLFIIIGFFAISLSIGIKAVYAYYHDSLVSGILANKVGDFDSGDGDVNMLIYKMENSKPVRVYAVPGAYYKFNDSLTSCKNSSNQTVICNDGTGNCEYSYNNLNKSFSLTSNQKLTCKFYFEPETSSDINIYVYVEDENGLETYTTKKYTLMDYIPAYGYSYSEQYVCDSPATLTYDSTTRKFTIATGTKNNCSVYFNSIGSSDIIANVYVQSSYGSEVYDIVNTIPTNRIYELNQTKSHCYDDSGTETNGTITYVDGYINIASAGQQSCDVYLDLQS